MTMPATLNDPHSWLRRQTRWHPLEIAFWLATLLPYFLFPSYLVLASQIAITALFALSLDLILGSLTAACLIGITDVAGKYYVPETGAFLIYLVMMVVLMWRPAGLFARR